MTWVDAARRGDEDAATQLVREFHARVFAFLRRLSGSESEAAELTQRTFCRAWGALPAFAGRASVSSWLHGIAYRTYVDWLRSNRRREEKPEAWWEGLADQRPRPDVAAAAADTTAAVYAAVDRLEDGLRETLHLHYYQGLSLEETAEALGIAASTVKYRLREGLDQVRRLIARSETSPSTIHPTRS